VQFAKQLSQVGKPELGMLTMIMIAALWARLLAVIVFAAFFVTDAIWVSACLATTQRG